MSIFFVGVVQCAVCKKEQVFTRVLAGRQVTIGDVIKAGKKAGWQMRNRMNTHHNSSDLCPICLKKKEDLILAKKKGN